MQIAKLLAAEHSPIHCVIDTRQLQTGTDDCGLFALAADTSICFKCPGSLKYDQPAMRQHFNTCMRNGIMTPFPRITTAVRRQPANKCVEIDIYCRCLLTTWCCATSAISGFNRHARTLRNLCSRTEKRKSGTA